MVNILYSGGPLLYSRGNIININTIIFTQVGYLPPPGIEDSCFLLIGFLVLNIVRS